MPHVRLNEREANPNPYVNFITPLPGRDAADEEDARQLLRALAAQVKPIMKAHGLAVNTLNEYQYNKVFLGRNWENGSVVEIVLRGANGRFQPISWLMGTLCHELAHIKHMNHGPGFQAFNAQLCKEVRELQRKGYYGDGLWSSGQRLADSAPMGWPGLAEAELPEYLCGGAQSRKPPSTQQRRRRRTEGPSAHTGRQTTKKRKAGSRVTAKGTFEGSGRALNDDVEDEAAKKAGAGFRKQAGSKSAREARALAVERRLLALQGSKPGQSSTSTVPEPITVDDSESDSGSEEEELLIPETDQDRRRTLLESDANAGKLKQTTLHDFANDFFLPPSQASSSGTNGGKGKASDRGGSSVNSSSSKRPRKDAAGRAVGSKSLTDFFSVAPADDPSAIETEPNKKRKIQNTNAANALSYGGLVQGEVDYRKKESLGMQAGSSRTLSDGRLSESRNPLAGRSRLLDLVPDTAGEDSSGGGSDVRMRDGEWSCLVCTLINEPNHLACSACTTPRGES